MRTIRLTLAYDGTAYAGWQWQAGQSTIQGELEGALFRVTSEKIRVVGSGRTDAGVHAQGQVASFTTSSQLSSDVLMRALNATLPRNIAVLAAADAPADFHATRDARRKRYRYTIHDGSVRDVFHLRYAWHVYRRLDAQAMHRAAQPLRGRHDFASFQTSGSGRETSVRTILDISVVRDAEHGDLLHCEVEADGFLYNMVRAIVGTLVEIGRGARHEGWAAEVLEARDRRAAGKTAPAHGLCLLRVDYD